MQSNLAQNRIAVLSPSQRRMHLSTAHAGQAHSAAAAGNTLMRTAGRPTLHWARTHPVKTAPSRGEIWIPSNTWLMVPWTNMSPQMASRSVQPFSRSLAVYQHTDTSRQTTLRAISAAIGCNYALRAGDTT